MTHKELVDRGLRWLRNRCTIAFAELRTAAGEIPDVWGYGGRGSELIECKASRDDFLSDPAKYHRRRPERGMGQLRYYMCPKDMIKPGELPENWGLLYCLPTMIKVVVRPQMFTVNLAAEREFLVSIVRRCAIRWPIDDIHDFRTAHQRRS